MAWHVVLRRCCRPRFAWQALSLSALRCVLGCALATLAACGDALLPANYTGPPALAVGGSVVRSPKGDYIEAQNPQLSVLWLADVGESPGSPQFLTQPVAFRRSQQLHKDWEIGMAVPLESAKIRRNVGASNPRLAIGQLVYFDDVDEDGAFSGPCKGRRCDEVKAFSSEFVVFLEQPITCQTQSALGLETTSHAAGFHYFTWDGQSIQEGPLSRDLQFVLHESPPVWSDYAAAVKNFAHQLTRAYQLNTLGGC